MDGLGWAQSKISRIENFRTALTIDDLYQAAEYYGKSPWDLMNVDPSKEREVVDAIDLFGNADDEQRKAIADFSRYVTERDKRAG